MSKRLKITFPGSDGSPLSGLLEQPDNSPSAYVLFAHCFTCGKDIAAASRIAKALTHRGYAVLRFDFTGLGNSDGDFSNTNFSSNVDDLIAAADYLRQHYQAPKLLIGHSLGGAAVLKAAEKIPESQGLVTIGSPANANNVSKQFSADIATIEAQGHGDVMLAGRKFTIKKQFLDDLQQQDSDHLGRLNKALLIFHSPIDATVSIEHAETLYRAAKHPKSFISLDKADHLLSSKDDAEYVAATIAAWATRYLCVDDLIEPQTSSVNKGHICVKEHNRQFSRSISSDSHQWLADEPIAFGGHDLGPDPYEHLLAALGACTSMTMRMYANRKKLALDDIQVELNHSRKHIDDCESCDSEKKQIDVIQRTIQIKGDLSNEERQSLIAIADKCPVHRTLENTIVIETQAVD